MKNFPSVFNFATIVNEMKVYSAFFDEKTNVDFSTGDVLNRVWSYRWAENSFLANKTIFMYSRYEATLYDFSALLTEEVTIENCKNFENRYGVKVYDLTKERLTISQIKEILANNAKAAIRAEKLTKQVTKFKNMSEDF
jgi:hypothetical protein